MVLDGSQGQKAWCTGGEKRAEGDSSMCDCPALSDDTLNPNSGCIPLLLQERVQLMNPLLRGSEWEALKEQSGC